MTAQSAAQIAAAAAFEAWRSVAESIYLHLNPSLLQCLPEDEQWRVWFGQEDQYNIILDEMCWRMFGAPSEYIERYTNFPGLVSIAMSMLDPRLRGSPAWHGF